MFLNCIIFASLFCITLQVQTRVYNLKRLSGRNESCSIDSDCPANAYCEKNNECKCKLGFVPDRQERGTKCLKEASYLGEACESDIQCLVPFGNHAQCRQTDAPNLQCLCKNDSHFRDGICYKSARIGDRCDVDDNCHIKSENIGVNAYCDKSVCICPPHRHPSDDATDCLPSAGLEESCGSDKDCIVQNSRCFDVCRCDVAYVLSIDRHKCLPAADKLDWACEEDRQCTEFINNAMCDAKKKRCVCAPFAHQVHNACWVKIALGESCDHNYECVTKSGNYSRVECNKVRRCQCTLGHTPQNDDCVPGGSVRQLLNPILLVISIFVMNV